MPYSSVAPRAWARADRRTRGCLAAFASKIGSLEPLSKMESCKFREPVMQATGKSDIAIPAIAWYGSLRTSVPFAERDQFCNCIALTNRRDSKTRRNGWLCTVSQSPRYPQLLGGWDSKADNDVYRACFYAAANFDSKRPRRDWFK